MYEFIRFGLIDNGILITLGLFGVSLDILGGRTSLIISGFGVLFLGLFLIQMRYRKMENNVKCS